MWARIDAIFRTCPGPPVLHQRAAKVSFVSQQQSTKAEIQSGET
jgi:hypothetical protein